MYTESFLLREISDNTYLIDDNGMATAYLIIGKDKALLIDTGMGFNNLYSVVKGITELPLVVVNTHGHCDHVWGNYQFEEAYISDKDKVLYDEAYSIDIRKSSMEMFKDMIPSNVTSEDIEKWINVASCKILSIKQGDLIDLGDRVLQVIETPGHTKGSIVLLDEKEKILFAGDSIIGRLWMHLEESISLKNYLKSIEGLKVYCNKFEKIYHGHTKYNEEPYDVSFVEEVIRDVSTIIEGKCVGTYLKDISGECLVCDFEHWSVWYKFKKNN
ncbi:MBL fold metallo-hydrolase [Clostridium cellulovorans]|uniref:Beta-lactamase domain protein n=1 Tax=Clostridium cellulovorans (strain ATCC 35296 / DSM 3052 / OCM 3 / 743B) TaxID=573061 RepID=D9SNB8_CLOC7|nr:MBL fold metallo-hydrolase [Clostridium cellulovorans]ADL53910.1 beta-lactamase domain protein [Clostridium cellulovorans 743B]